MGVGSGKWTFENWPIAAAMLPFPASKEAGPKTWIRQLAEVAFEGFDLIDVTDNWLPSGDLDQTQVELLRESLTQTGMGIAAFSVIRRSVIDPQRGLDNLAYSHRAIDNAAALGVPVVSVGLHRPLGPGQDKPLWFWTVQGPVDEDTEQNWELAAKRIRELGEHAEQNGIQLSLEMYEDTLIGSSEGGVRLIEQVGLDNVGLNPDLGNMFRLHRETENFLEAVARCAPYTNYWHVKSYLRDEDPGQGWVSSAPAPMEYGSMNYREAVKIMLAEGFDGAFCVEHYGGDGLSVATTNARYLRRMLAVALGEPLKQIKAGEVR